MKNKLQVKDVSKHVYQKLDFKIDLKKFIAQHPKMNIEPMNPEIPVDFMIVIPQCENQRFRITESGIRGFVKPSIWNRIKGDFDEFLKDIEWEKCKKEDLEIDEFKSDMRKIKKFFKKR